MIPLAYREYEPSRRLAPFVRAYFSFGPQEHIAKGFALKHAVAFADVSSVSPIMMADMATSIVLKSGDEWSVVGGEAVGPAAAATLFGPMVRGYATRIGPRINAAGVYFRVGALGHFVALSMDELVGRGLPVGELFGVADHEAIATTFETPDPTARLRALEAVLVRRIRRESLAPYHLVRRFYQQCLSPCGPASVDTMALELGVSRQYLARQLRRWVGAPPKLVARVARFQSVLKVMAASSTSWADIAAGLGYCDQSHLIADFRGFSATSPAALNRAGQFHPHHL